MAVNQNTVTPQFIKSEFPKYVHAERCSVDLCAALEKYSNLMLRKRECVVDGHLYDMINLEGTLPINYKGNTYNIPLRVLMTEDYPLSAPIIYIQPTEGMRMATNVTYLNDRGKVSIGYLDEWRSQNHPNLSKVLHRLIILFEDFPPVWTKKTGSMVKAYEEKAKRNSFPPRSRPASRSKPTRKSKPEEVYEDIDPLPDPNVKPSPAKPNKDYDGYDIPDNGKGNSLPSPAPFSPPMPLKETGFQDNLHNQENDCFVPHDPSESSFMSGKFFPEVHQGQSEEFVGEEFGKESSASQHEKLNHHAGSQESGPNVLQTCKRIKLIGSGGFAKVYLYENRSSKAKFACKIVDLGVNDASVQKHAIALKHEIELLSTLKYNHFIVNYFAVEEYNNELAMVMEYFPKGSIYQVLQNSPDGHFNEDITRVYTWQILQGLKFLHENSVIHRDIKARNILVDERNTIRIADFGISKKIENLVTQTTGNIDVLGSIYWQSPESLCPETKCGRKTDVWSLGCTVVEMLLGKPPLSCDNIPLRQATVKIINCEVRPPPDFSDIAKEFLQLCFRRETERPSSHEIMAKSEFPQYSLG